MSVVLSCCGMHSRYGYCSSTATSKLSAVGWLRIDDQLRPPLSVTFAPPSFTCRKMSGLSGLIHMPWLSPCGVFMVVNVFPPSVDLWNPSSLTNTVFSFFRADVDVVEIERRAQALAAVDERPRFARVARTIEAAFNGRRFDHRVARADCCARYRDRSCRSVSPAALTTLFPGVTAVDRLPDAALVGRAATDDVPALAESAVGGRIQHVGVLASRPRRPVHRARGRRTTFSSSRPPSVVL